ncbi:trypsin-like serine peptidase [Roseivivax isoporae]|nr:trypsin-like peptidase domain-containing protein [Roseivivax isoporae]
MPRALPLLAALLLAAPVAGTARADDAVGRVNAGGFDTRSMCTGTLVAPGRVLTAAHCVLWPDGRERQVSDIVFVAGWDGAGHAGAARAASVALHPRALADGRIDVRHDLAVIDLVRPIEGPTLEVGSAGPAGPLALAGYTRSRPHRLSVTEDCAGTADGTLWRVGCTIEHGQSGGPVIYGTGAARRVVAVISARTEGGALVVPVDGWARARLAEPYTSSAD